MEIALHLIPDNTAFPSKTRQYGSKTRYEIRRHVCGAQRSFLNPGDQPTRKGNMWAHETRERAEKVCRQLNAERARGVIERRGIKVDDVTNYSPTYFATYAGEFAREGDLEAAAQLLMLAKASSVGHQRRADYEKQADDLRALDLKRSRGES